MTKPWSYFRHRVLVRSPRLATDRHLPLLRPYYLRTHLAASRLVLCHRLITFALSALRFPLRSASRPATYRSAQQRRAMSRPPIAVCRCCAPPSERAFVPCHRPIALRFALCALKRPAASSPPHATA